MSEHRVLSGETAFGNDEKAVYEALRSIPPGLILDVGAGAGYKTKTALLHSPSSRAIAFEPFPGNWSFIDKVLGEYPNVNIVKEAVSDTPGEASFYVSTATKAEGVWEAFEGYSSAGYIVEDGGKYPAEKVYKVPVTTIDSHVSERVSFMKIDVQGGELAVLRGASETFERGIDLLFIEFQGDIGILDFLFERGYIVFDLPFSLVARNPETRLSAGWKSTEETLLSTGATSVEARRSTHISDPVAYCNLFESHRKDFIIWNDIVAVKPTIAAKLGWL